MKSYIEFANQFWQYNNEQPIGVNCTALYFYLLKVNNSLNWKPTFKHSDKRISIDLGISINTVRTSKEKLRDLGLINFSAPGKPSKGIEGCTTFSFETISQNDSVDPVIHESISNDDMVELVTISNNDIVEENKNTTISQNDTVDFLSLLNDDTVDSKNDPTISKYDRVDNTEIPTIQATIQATISPVDSIIRKDNKYNIISPLSPKGKTKNSTDKVFLLSIPDEWKPIVSDWLEYKRERNQSYKGEKSLVVMFNKLKRYSRDDPARGAVIIENSISNNYSGFFELKTYGTVRTGSTKMEESEFLTAVANGLSRGVQERDHCLS